MIDVKFTQTNSLREFNLKGDDIVQVTGYAVHTGTFNGITIERDELHKSVRKLIGKPLLINHDNGTSSVVGKVTNAVSSIDPATGTDAIEYTADVDAHEEDIIRKMQLGFLDSTSIGFKCDHICSICGSDIYKCDHWYDDDGFQVLAKNIDFYELSIVAVPADPDASVKISFSAKGEERFEELKLKKQELRRTNMSDLEQKYNDVVDEFNQFKLEAADKTQKLEEEFAAKKAQLESEKADKIEENLSLKAEMETLQKDNDKLQKKVDEFSAKFEEIETERLSSLREKVTELSNETNAGLSDEEILELDETMLRRYENIFTNQLKTMTKVVPKPVTGGETQYQAPIDENAPISEQFLAKVKNVRGF